MGKWFAILGIVLFASCCSAPINPKCSQLKQALQKENLEAMFTACMMDAAPQCQLIADSEIIMKDCMESAQRFCAQQLRINITEIRLQLLEDCR